MAETTTETKTCSSREAIAWEAFAFSRLHGDDGIEAMRNALAAVESAPSEDPDTLEKPAPDQTVVEYGTRIPDTGKIMGYDSEERTREITKFCADAPHLANVEGVSRVKVVAYGPWQPLD